jgi:VanZ family protein
LPDQDVEPHGWVNRLRTRRPPAIFLAWLMVAVWAGVIFALSATPHLRVAEDADLDFILRKAGHMAAFGILAVLLWRALTLSAIRRAIVWSVVLTVAYATTDEFHQSFTAGRNASGVDVSIDAAGALIALLALALWMRAGAARIGRPGLD